MNLNVDKSQWTKVRLGDVATEYSSRINDPSSGDRERFVGSSCIGQWDFRVQEWESTASVTSAMKLFEEGDYLLVRRSLYASDFRERAPRAHFAGVCSGDILTIRENPEFIADGFLIGILNNPSIWSYIVANASGSITRRIKWKDLANYEFLLPPKDQQAEIAELLWALDESISKLNQTCRLVGIAQKAYLKHCHENGLSGDTPLRNSVLGKVPEHWGVFPLRDLGEFKNGINKDKSAFGRGKTLINLENVFSSLPLSEQSDFGLVEATKTEVDLYNLKRGDLLFVRSSVKPEGVGLTKAVSDDFPGVVFSGFIIRFRPHNENLDSNFLSLSLSLDQARYRLLRRSTTSANTNINQKALEKIFVHVPPVNEQRQIVANANEMYKLESSISSMKAKGMKLSQVLVQSFF